MVVDERATDGLKIQGRPDPVFRQLDPHCHFNQLVRRVCSISDIQNGIGFLPLALSVTLSAARGVGQDQHRLNRALFTWQVPDTVSSAYSVSGPFHFGFRQIPELVS